VAKKRASICNAHLAEFEVLDVRDLDRRLDLQGEFDLVICCENIEHIFNDQKLMLDMSRCLKPGGTLLLTTPNFNYRPMTRGDEVFSQIEDGGHVRRGYAPEGLERLCSSARLNIVNIGYCSGFVSQKLTALMRITSAVHPLFGWGLVLPLRALPLILDSWVSKRSRWPGFSITLVAAKP
jgi:2-polyprenyl-3-methyl-5-hydroxy-6-metoxy-1,4-benzoquinol methylase